MGARVGQGLELHRRWPTAAYLPPCTQEDSIYDPRTMMGLSGGPQPPSDDDDDDGHGYLEVRQFAQSWVQRHLLTLREKMLILHPSSPPLCRSYPLLV